MITDDLKLVFIKEKLFSELKEDFALAGYSFNKQLIAKKKSKDNFEIEIYLLSNNYHPIHYEIYFHGGISHKELLQPLKELFQSIEKDLSRKSINNYLWSMQFHMGDFNSEVQNELGVYRKSNTFNFDSKEGFGEAIKKLKSILFIKAIPTFDILVNSDLLRKNIFEIADLFREEFLNIYSLMVFSFIYDRNNFHLLYQKILQTTSDIKSKGETLSDYFDHLAYVKNYLYSNYNS